MVGSADRRRPPIAINPISQPLTARKTGPPPGLLNHQESGDAAEAVPAFRIAHASFARNLSRVSHPPPPGLERCQKRESGRSEDRRQGTRRRETPVDCESVWRKPALRVE